MRISYVQRCYYQPVTEYVQKKYIEPVTRNVTSYYYEPVTEYKLQHLLRPLHRLPAEGLHAVHVVPPAEQVQLGDELRRAVLRWCR